MQNKENYSEEKKITEIKIDSKKIKRLSNGFYAYRVEKNEYQLIFCNQVVSPRKYRTIKEMEEEIEKKPWDILLITSKVYIDRVSKLEKQ